MKENTICTSCNSTNKRIAICAQSFGFGPVSKACAIAKALCEGCQNIDLVCIADSISKEFLQREGIWKDGFYFTISDDKVGELKHHDFQNFDAAVVVLDPKLASFFQTFVPTFFIDSLGFMWDDGFFKQFPLLKNLHTYFVQDVFDAYTHLVLKGVERIYPVGAIIDPHTTFPKEVPDVIFHLGGLINIFNRSPIQYYVEGIIPFLEKLGAGQSTMILTSQQALDEFEILRTTTIPVRNLPHDQTLGMFACSRSVFTSPGLTTLLELMSLRVPAIPLPPQNLSQALIINNLVVYWDKAPEIWGFLAKHYPLTKEMDEAEGVRMVQAMNAQLLNQPDFHKNYIHLAQKAKNQAHLLPSHLISDMNGVNTIRSVIYRELDLLPTLKL